MNRQDCNPLFPDYNKISLKYGESVYVMNDDEIENIKFNSDATKGLALKTLILLIAFIFPLLVIYLLQGIMTDLWGEPSPLSPIYLTLVGVLLVWFAVGLLLIIPRAGRWISKRYGTSRDSFS